MLIFSSNLIASDFKDISQAEYTKLLKLEGEDLKDELRDTLRQGFHAVGYNRAKEIIFGRLDNENGEVCCVYSEHNCLRTKSVPDHTRMNVEHTWPQSKGASGEAKSDLHHLYPADSKVNSTRSNFPFCEVSNLKWQNKVSKQGKNQWGENCFEPPATHKGNVARSSFYFAIKYGKQITEHEEKVLREWNKEDPVDQDEIARNRAIYNYQGNPNIFVEHPELVDQIANF